MTCIYCGNHMIIWDHESNTYLCLQCEQTNNYNDNRGG